MLPSVEDKFLPLEDVGFCRDQTYRWSAAVRAKQWNARLRPGDVTIHKSLVPITAAECAICQRARREKTFEDASQSWQKLRYGGNMATRLRERRLYIIQINGAEASQPN